MGISRSWVAVAASVALAGCGGSSGDKTADGLAKYVSDRGSPLESGSTPAGFWGTISAACDADSQHFTNLAVSWAKPGKEPAAKRIRLGIEYLCPDRLAAWDQAQSVTKDLGTS